VRLHANSKRLGSRSIGRLPVPNHPGDMAEGTLRAILKQTGINPDEFVST
jgi:predicted RNA binding protein YcfA (HicA-like mRNA interferase family)